MEQIIQIEYDRQIVPAFVGPQVGDVRCPDSIGDGWRKIPIQPVWRHRQVVLRVRRGRVPPFVPRPDAVLSHQPLNPFLAGREPTPPQLPDHSRGAVGALKFFVNGAYQHHRCESVSRARSGVPPCFHARWPLSRSPQESHTSRPGCSSCAATSFRRVPCEVRRRVLGFHSLALAARSRHAVGTVPSAPE